MRRGAPRAGRPRQARLQAGLTLTEVLVASFIVLLLAAAAAQLLTSSWASQETVTGQNEVQRRAQQAADAIVDSLRGAAEVQSGEPSRATCSFADGSTMTFYLQNGELLRDTYDGVTGDIVTGDVVCRNVTLLSFGYYRREGNAWVEAASASLAESLLVSVTISDWKYHATQTSLVKFRNKV